MSHASDAEFIALQAALAGQYSLERELGRGGMGIVYLAREVRLARPVAIKVLPPALGDRADMREAFLREAQLAAQLMHPHIVPVFGAGESGGFTFIVMAYVEGITLGERIRTRGPLLPGQAARMLREVSWALAYAHGAGIVHRDVTAENILLERGSDRAIVMDFGIASAMQSAALSADGRVMGNAHYVSPEQAAGEPLDARSDLYSLGVVGFYALTGRLPFDGPTPADVVTQHLTTAAPSIASVADQVPSRLAMAVEKCLSKEPLRRYRNAESFAEAIDLAFEHAKEIPAPLRVWIREGENQSGPRALVAILVAPIALLVVLAQTPHPLLAMPVLGFGFHLVSALVRARRVLKQGYDVTDMSAALREYQLLRSEELAYEQSLRSPWVRKASIVGLATSSVVIAAGIAASVWLYPLTIIPVDYEHIVRNVGIAGGAVFILSGAVLLSDWLRKRFPARSLSVSFWKSRWGARLARVASIGLKKVGRPAIGMPMLTEVALGRATDHLFQALPRASRKQLAELPPLIKRLEGDAGRLRASIDELDDQIAVFEREGDAPRAGSLRVTLAGDAAYNVERTQVEHELRAARSLATERLGATVAALENIRLDLLRLQMGSTGIESVTASLEAARRVNDQIADAAAAQNEVERFLRAVPESIATDDATHESSDDDADTPVGGVSAAGR